MFDVRIGDTHLYGERHATAKETYNLTVQNVYGAGKYALSPAGAIENLKVQNVTCTEGTKLLWDERISKT